MAKKIKALVRLMLKGGSATPAPPAGSALGPHGVNIMDFCKAFNAQTADKKGQTVPVVITVYTDRSFEFVTKTEPVTDLIKKAVKISKGSSNPKATRVGQITLSDVEEIAKIKMPDLNAVDLDAAKKIVAGSARSMGVDVVDNT
jgi:large subunit ribosomal protein L11